MTPDELIVKQQLEIEALKAEQIVIKSACGDARSYLIHAEQWSTKSDEFPRVAINAIVRARMALDEIERTER